MNAPSISLIIPNRDGQAYLATCLDAIAAQSLKPTETIVVDDGSQDESVRFLNEQYPWVTVLHSSDRGEPQGFAGTCNRGIRAAQGQLIALLNNDTEAEVDWLREMADCLARHPEAASVGCCMLQKNGTHLNAAGLMLHEGCTAGTIGDGDPDGPPYEEEIQIFGPSGGAALWRRDILDRIGLFEEPYFAYYEDADLSFRARSAGFTSWYAPKSRVIHLEGRCPSLKRVDKVMLRIRNGLWFAWTNLPASLLLKHLGAIVWSTSLRYLFKYGFRPWKVEGRSFWKAVLAVKLSPKRFFQMRRKRRQMRSASAEELAHWIGRNPFRS